MRLCSVAVKGDCVVDATAKYVLMETRSTTSVHWVCNFWHGVWRLRDPRLPCFNTLSAVSYDRVSDFCLIPGYVVGHECLVHYVR